MRINYHYSIRYKPIYLFSFVKYNKYVDLTLYKKYILNQIDDAVDSLIENNSSRQAVMAINRGIKEHCSCCLSLQFQIVKKRLILIANYRSQCKKYGRPIDEIMLRFLVTFFLKKLKNKGIVITKIRFFINCI